MEQSQPHLLLIDDDPLFLRLLADCFTDAGFMVSTAADGIAGLQSYLDHRPDVVISDLIMPRMGGVSTLMEIARRSEDHQPVTILMTSMFHGAPHEHDLPEMGARIHIPKSTPPLDVVIIVEQLLARKAVSAETGH